MNLGFLKIGAESSASFWMPSQSSTVAADVDGLFYFILLLSTFFFVVIMAAMVYFLVKYKRTSPNQKTSALKGNHTLEIAWSVIPGLLLVVIFAWAFFDWTKMVVPPANSLQVRVTGQKWSWAFSYPKEGVVGNSLVVPVGRPVQLTMSSRDVIHSFYVPAFRVKRDVLPNRYTVMWFEPTETGEFDIFCTEYCGNAHSNMISKVKVLSEQEFANWVAQGGDGGGNGDPIEVGKGLFEAKGCNACHGIDGSVKVGPALNGIYGKERELADGSKALADDNYIRESIMVPGAKVAKGFQPVMPSFQGQLTDKQVEGLIEYLKSLK